MRPIKQKEIDDRVARLKQRGRQGAALTKKRILGQMRDQREIIEAAQHKLIELERELTIELIAMDAVGMTE